MIKKEVLLNMGEVREQWCVSMYLPVNRVDPAKNRIRLKNLITEAQKKLEALDVYSLKAAKLLAPIEMILENQEFWKYRNEGFAAFFTNDSFVWYSVPYQAAPLAVVTDRFHLKPLLRKATTTESFYLLTLSQKLIRFFEASELGANEIFPRGMPRSVVFENAADNSNLQMRSDGHGSVIYHGHGGMEENNKNRITETFRKVNKAVTKFLNGEDSPLILAGVDYLHPLYKEVNEYKSITAEGIIGNTDNLSPKELLEKALPIIKPMFRGEREKALQVFQAKLGTGLASGDLQTVLKAAQNGRVETLFVPVGKQEWGTYDSVANKLRVHKKPKPGDKDLLCVASTKTLLKGGKIYAVLPEQMPNNATIAAVMRY